MNIRERLLNRLYNHLQNYGGAPESIRISREDFLELTSSICLIETGMRSFRFHGPGGVTEILCGPDPKLEIFNTLGMGD